MEKCDIPTTFLSGHFIEENHDHVYEPYWKAEKKNNSSTLIINKNLNISKQINPTACLLGYLKSLRLLEFLDPYH